MLKQAIFCDLCKEHVKDGEGQVFAYYDGRVFVRIFKYAGTHDICICNKCAAQLVEKIANH